MLSSGAHGQIGVRNGTITVVNPQGDGLSAVLYPPEEKGVIFFNGKPVEEAIEVKEEDVIEVKESIVLEEPKLTVKVSSDGLSATVAVFPKVTGFYRLKDTEMSASLKPVLEKKEEIEPTLAIMDAETALLDKKVTEGIDYIALKNALEKAEGIDVVVARGKPKTEGKNGYIEYLINTEVETISYEDEVSRADFRERYRYPTLKKGDIIAVLHPPLNGVPGKTVTGNIIPPKPVRPAKCRLREGVSLSEGKPQHIISSRDGRLVVQGSNIKVVNLLVHHGDVDLESGNIRFIGDATVYGNITEGMMVDVLGDLQVEGNVYGAKLSAGGGISISKNIIKCQVDSGTFYGTIDLVVPVLKNLEREYSSFLAGFKEVIKGVAGKGQEINQDMINKIFQAVLEKSAPDMGERVKALDNTLSKNEDVRFDLLKGIVKLLSAILSKDLLLNKFNDLDKIETSIRAMLRDFEATLDEKPEFKASYIQNSQINHAGHVFITGAGGYFSSVHAAGEVNVDGVFRGGSIEAGSHVKIKEFISISTAAESAEKKAIIRIKVPSHAAVYLDVVHEDTTVQIGKLVYRFEQDFSKIKLFYDSSSGMIKMTNY